MSTIPLDHEGVCTLHSALCKDPRGARRAARAFRRIARSHCQTEEENGPGSKAFQIGLIMLDIGSDTTSHVHLMKDVLKQFYAYMCTTK